MYVELKDINKTFGDYKASDHVSFGIEKGKLIGLLGPSGSGKTTILRMIAGLEQPDSGEIIIDGRVVNDIPASERGIGFVFQSYALFRYMTVYDNIAFGLKVQKADKTYIKKRVTELIELIGLKGLEKRYPSKVENDSKAVETVNSLSIFTKCGFSKSFFFPFAITASLSGMICISTSGASDISFSIKVGLPIIFRLPITVLPITIFVTPERRAYSAI